MLRYVGSAKLMFLCRMLPPVMLASSLRSNDAAMRSCLGAVLGQDVSDAQWAQAKVYCSGGYQGADFFEDGLS